MSRVKVSVLFVVVALLCLGAVAGEAKTVTVEGKIACAKCTLETGAKECQDVLVVEKDGETMHYYLAENDVAKEYGHSCMGSKPAVVTGTVEEKDGKMWLTATEMVAPDKG